MEEAHMTIVRLWSGITLGTNAGEYVDYLEKTFIPACQIAEGNQGLLVMKALQGELAQFLLVSFWISEQALADFAGTDGEEVVKPCPEESSLLLAFESTARHYRVVYRSADHERR
jgi:heme-degrading monooxygenase HmoA